MFLGKEQKKIVGYQLLLYTVLILATAALIAEMLPEVKAKMLVIPVLLLIIATCTIDLYRLGKEAHLAQEER
ncbi:MAG TPA: hypothetical protein VKA95_17935 [Nitrososphaeraceae archaeon]|nr:hypothetical protein [Nitrososphaeraceae archaeon]